MGLLFKKSDKFKDQRRLSCFVGHPVGIRKFEFVAKPQALKIQLPSINFPLNISLIVLNCLELKPTSMSTLKWFKMHWKLPNKDAQRS